MITKEEALKKIDELKKFIEQEENKETEVPIIPNMLYWFWDISSVKRIGHLKCIMEKSKYNERYTDNADNNWVHCEPAWDLIWTLLNLPEWVQWVAMDKDGVWYGYEKKPIMINCGHWQKIDIVRKRFSFIPHKYWKDSLMKRPDVL